MIFLILLIFEIHYETDNGVEVRFRKKLRDGTIAIL